MFNPSREDAVDAPPIWAVYGDLMAGLFGIFVLFFVWAISFQVDLTDDLHDVERVASEQAARLSALERALAGPLAEGRITYASATGNIGIRGSLLFDSTSDELRPGGEELLRELAGPLRRYLESSDDMVMISGFTDDQPLREGSMRFKDNLELSAQRALTVTRALVAAGVPADRVIPAGFGSEHAAVPNDTDENRAQNRRVEIAPVKKAPSTPSAS
jgi:flagellar motor protein MotB